MFRRHQKTKKIIAKYVGDTAKGRISKRVVSRKQSTPEFPKNKHFLPPSFLACFAFLKHPF